MMSLIRKLGLLDLLELYSRQRCEKSIQQLSLWRALKQKPRFLKRRDAFGAGSPLAQPLPQSHVHKSQQNRADTPAPPEFVS
jgi:hypothetical protein